MNTKKCSKCGWVYPKEWPGRTCKFCHGPIQGGFCIKCGEWFDDLHHKKGMCKKCWAEVNLKWKYDRKANAETKYNDWLALIKKIPTPYKTLTEDEWLEACAHFGGCAYCGDEQIDARAMFIQFKKGGRYCAWNVVPMCDKCAKIHGTLTNPFDSMDLTVHRRKSEIAKKYNHDLDKLQVIVDYLYKKLEELI